MSLRPAEWVLGAVCLVYPFRLMLNALAGTDLHLGLLSFAVVGIVALLVVREAPAGLPLGIDLAIAGFALVLLADLLLTGPTAQAVKGLSVELRFAVFYFVGRLFGLGRAFAIWLLGMTVALGVAAAVVGALDYHLGWGTVLRAVGGGVDARFWKGGIPRLYSFAMSPLAAAYLIVLAFAAAIGLFAENRRPLAVVLAAVVLWQALPLTLARAALLAVGLLLVGFVVVDRRSGARFLLASFVGIAIMVATLAGRGASERQVTYVRKSVALADGSSVAHLTSFEKGIELVTNHPLGVGLGQGGHVAMLRGGIYPYDDTYYVTLAVQTGLPGLSAFLVVLGFALRLWWRELRTAAPERRGLGLAGLGIFVSLAIGGLFVATWTMLVPQLYFWVLTAAAANLAAAPGALAPEADARPA